MDKEQALHNFYSGFSISAYDVNSVPDNAVMPYLTYEVKSDSFDNTVFVSPSLWYNSTSWASITQKAQEISDYLGLGGKLIHFDDGSIWIKRATPFAQRISTDKDTVKRISLNLGIEFFSEN